MSRILRGLIVTCLVSGTALADRPRDVMVPMPKVPGTEAVTSNIIYLDRCAGGCSVTHAGSDDATTVPYRSTIGGGVIQAFSCSDTVWQQVVSCMKDAFSSFNVQITDVRPGSGSYLGIIIAGTPQNIGLGGGVGGIAPFRCQPYQQNALVFDFGNVWQCNVEEICSTAAQEIAHTWSLDHSTLASDPMTYYGYSSCPMKNPTTGGCRRYYANMDQQCGSDCVGGQSPNGTPCSGNPAQNHPCSCTGQNTQNDYAEILALFGAGTPTPPVVKITSPKNGDNVSPGFAVDATVTSDFGTAKAELRVDNTLVGTLTSMPYAFNAPSSLGNGNHHVEVTGYDIHSNSAKTAIDVYIGPPCQKPADCPMMTDTCIGGRCVPGPGVQGGLGMVCTTGTDCASGQCATDGTNHYCVEPCMVGQCPASFGCLDTGGGGMVCWPGFNDGSGGCSTGAGGPISLGLAFAALVFTRRRRPS